MKGYSIPPEGSRSPDLKYSLWREANCTPREPACTLSEWNREHPVANHASVGSRATQASITSRRRRSSQCRTSHRSSANGHSVVDPDRRARAVQAPLLWRGECPDRNLRHHIRGRSGDVVVAQKNAQSSSRGAQFHREQAGWRLACVCNTAAVIVSSPDVTQLAGDSRLYKKEPDTGVIE